MALAYASYAELEDSTATFTFGKIEILKTGEGEWHFLEKDAALTASDLVRMPPFSLIRLKIANDTDLPTLSGGREILVRTLIDEGLERKNAKKGKRINENFEDSPAIDVLPVGNKPKTESRVSAFDKIHAIKVNQRDLEDLRSQLDSLRDEIVSSIPRPLVSPAQENPVNRSYPSPNLDRARKLYRRLNAIEVETPNVPLLYAQLLRHVGIDVDLVANEKRELLIVFDSGISFGNAEQIAANQQLMYKKQEKDTVWISVLIQSPQQNFTTAWYQGSQQ
jgi:hypothetical protein